MILAQMTAGILSRTFVHVPGIGQPTEQSLWKHGITSWREFLRSSKRIGALLRLPKNSFTFIEQSEKALEKGDTAFFGKNLPRHEWWRLIPYFESKVVFLDIETTGLSSYYDDVTLIGLYDGQHLQTLLAGHNLEKLPEFLKKFDIVVTFNGSLFDLPFLKAKFPDLQFPPVHLDLRFLLRRLGLSGGLKQIEHTLGLKRDREVEEVNGFMATVLWARYQRGDLSALERLIRYNAADVTSLQVLLRYGCQQLARKLLQGEQARLQQVQPKSPKEVHVKLNLSHGSGVQLIVDRTKTILKTRTIQRPSVTMRTLLSRIPIRLGTPKVVGIDLRASESRPSGWALLAGEKAETRLVKTDEEIIQETIKNDPAVVSIDSPLSLPAGRCCTKDSCKCRVYGIMRECERTLWQRGVRVFPCLLPSMQQLTERGIRLANAFRKLGYMVIESYPGAAQDIMRIPRKKTSLDDLARGLASFGIKGKFFLEQTNHDELDAITSAVVAYFYLTGDYEALGNQCEDNLIVPKLDRLLSK